jgi:hypothetical protein
MYGSRGKAAAQKVEKSFLRTRPLLILCIAALALAALPSAASERPEEDDGGTSQGAERSFLEALTSKLLRRSDLQPRHLGHDTDSFGEDGLKTFGEEGDDGPTAQGANPGDSPPAAEASSPGDDDKAAPETVPAPDASGEAGAQGIGEETIKIGKAMGVQAEKAQKAKAGLDKAKEEKVPPWKKSFEELNAQADELRKKAVDSLNKMKGGVQEMAKKKKEIHKSVDIVEDHFKKEEEKTKAEGYLYKNVIDLKNPKMDPVATLGLDDDKGTAPASAPADEDAPVEISRERRDGTESAPPELS